MTVPLSDGDCSAVTAILAQRVCCPTCATHMQVDALEPVQHAMGHAYVPVRTRCLNCGVARLLTFGFNRLIRNGVVHGQIDEAVLKDALRRSIILRDEDAFASSVESDAILTGKLLRSAVDSLPANIRGEVREETYRRVCLEVDAGARPGWVSARLWAEATVIRWQSRADAPPKLQSPFVTLARWVGGTIGTGAGTIAIAAQVPQIIGGHLDIQTLASAAGVAILSFIVGGAEALDSVKPRSRSGSRVSKD